MPLAFPLMAAVQSMCAHIGRVTGKGLAANIKTTFSPVVLRERCPAAAGREHTQHRCGCRRHGRSRRARDWRQSPPHDRFSSCRERCCCRSSFPIIATSKFLKWLTLSLLAYAAVLFTVHVPWGEVALRTVWPQFTPNSTAAAVVVGVFGTTISPYLFFWQASEEVEDMQRTAGRPAARATIRARRPRNCAASGGTPGAACSTPTSRPISSFWRRRVTLHVAGITDIDTAAQAASALRPLAGNFAYVLFAIGILGVGTDWRAGARRVGRLCAAEAMGWKWGLERRATDARGFYGVITVSVLAGLVIQYSPISPMKALFWSAVINGVVAVPLMVVIILLVSKRR